MSLLKSKEACCSRPVKSPPLTSVILLFAELSFNPRLPLSLLIHYSLFLFLKQQPHQYKEQTKLHDISSGLWTLSNLQRWVWGFGYAWMHPQALHWCHSTVQLQPFSLALLQVSWERSTGASNTCMIQPGPHSGRSGDDKHISTGHFRIFVSPLSTH